MKIKTPKPLPQIKVDLGKAKPYPSESLVNQNMRIQRDNNAARRAAKSKP